MLGLVFVGQIGIISSLVNFGALTASCCCTCRSCPTTACASASKNIFLHWVAPVLGFLIIGFVLWNAEPAAKIGGVIWLALGALVLVYYTRGAPASCPSTPPCPDRLRRRGLDSSREARA